MEATTLERKLRLLVDLGYYPFWHNGCDGDGQEAGWVVSEEHQSCRKTGIASGSPRYGSKHHPTLEAAAEEALQLIAARAEVQEQQAERERAAAHAKREAIAAVRPRPRPSFTFQARNPPAEPSK